MNYGVQLVVWGDYACWTRPEMKVERVSYDVMTPSGARGILEAIYWKPQMRWVVDRIRVLRPIRFTNIRRNEVGDPHKVSIPKIKQAMGGGKVHLGITIEDNRQQRAGLILTDVRYGIEAHIEVLDPRERNGDLSAEPVAKHLDTARRRLQQGSCFHRPYLGCREFSAHVRPAQPGEFEAWTNELPEELKGSKDLGFMLHDLVHDARKDQGWRHCCTERCVPRFFRAHMVDGVIDLAACLATPCQEYGR
ncbi:MAG: type I-C CRISPR-associated protein Cas5 [Magnetococcales bacterium]|nr:type I-C CRISPR-associated protein Cas5 [Magnetococcales bacterium]